jgi:hypothetical protein
VIKNIPIHVKRDYLINIILQIPIFKLSLLFSLNFVCISVVFSINNYSSNSFCYYTIDILSSICSGNTIYDKTTKMRVINILKQKGIIYWYYFQL